MLITTNISYLRKKNTKVKMSGIVDESNNKDAEQVEQITKEPATIFKKSKDPKRVAAGKKLADYNKKAKQKQKQIQEKPIPVAEEENNEPGGYWEWFSPTSLIAIVGLGFTAFDLFLRYKTQPIKSETPSNNYINPPQKEDENLYSPPHPQYGME